MAFLKRFRYPALNVIHEGAYWRVLEQEDGLALVRVTWAGTVDAPVLRVDLAAQDSALDQQKLLSDLGQLLSIEADRASFFTMARRDDRLWTVVEPVYGLPDLRSSSVFEALMQTIIEQQIAWVAAQRAQHWLVEWAGRGLTYDGKGFYAFPSPGRIAGARLDDLKPLKITHGRIALMIRIAAAVVTGELDLEGIKSLPSGTAYERLLEIKGVGHWTAAVTVGRALGYDDHIPYDDAGLQAAVNHYFFKKAGRASTQAVIDTFAPYGEFAGKSAACTLSRWVLDRY